MTQNRIVNDVAIERLRRLGRSLEQHHFRWASAAIGSFLRAHDAGECASLDEAFGLVERSRPGPPASAQSKAYRNARSALLLFLEGKTWDDIEVELGVDQGQLRRELKRHRKAVIQELVSK